MNTAVDPHRRPAASPLAMLRMLIRNRRLVAQLIRREVVSRYRGSIMGLSWSFFNPLLMLAVYTFVFSVVFQARWGDTGGGKAGFAIFLFAGLLVHGVFAECINRGPSLIIGNVNYVKKVVFPLEVLVVVAMGSALFHAAVSLGVLLLVQAFTGGLKATALLFPLVLAPLVLVALGVSWFLAAVGVFMRDIGYVTQIITTVMLFMAPVFYPVSAMPEAYRHWMYVNPLTFVIEQGRGVLILGVFPDWTGLAMYAIAGIVVASLGFWCFQRMRAGFADVL